MSLFRQGGFKFRSYLILVPQSIKRAMLKVKELTPRGTHQPLEVAMKRINSWYKGWSGYYMMTQYPSQLQAIEAHIRRRLRSRFVDQQKKRRYLFRKLIKRGVSRRLASTVFSNNGRWVLSNTFALTRGYPVQWFIDVAGQWIRSTERQKGWFTTSSMDQSYMRSRVRTRTHGSVGRREPSAPSDPILKVLRL